MSDIVLRLREEAILIVTTHEYVAHTMRDAAALIERLRSDLFACRGLLATAVDAMQTNGVQCGLTEDWLIEAAKAAGGGDATS